MGGFFIGLIVGFLVAIVTCFDSIYNEGAKAVSIGEYECRLIERRDKSVEWECKDASAWGGK